MTANTLEPTEPEALSPEAARALTDEIRRHLATLDVTTDALDALVPQAYLGRAWLGTGHADWDAYCAAEFHEHRQTRLSRDRRRQLAAQWRDQHMSTRAIGSALGVDKGTVTNDLAARGETSPRAADDDAETETHMADVIGIDGKRYTPAKPERLTTAEVQARLQQVRTLAAQGLTAAQIGAAVGWTAQWVRARARKEGIALPGERATANTRAVSHADAFARLTTTADMLTTALASLDVRALPPVDVAEASKTWADLAKELSKFTKRLRERTTNP